MLIELPMWYTGQDNTHTHTFTHTDALNTSILLKKMNATISFICSIGKQGVDIISKSHIP